MSRITLHFAAVAALAVAGLAATPGALNDGPILGFTAEGSQQQRALEARFDSHLNANQLSEWNKQLSSRPNHVGAPHTRQNAEWMAFQFREWGYRVSIDTFQVLFPTPVTRVLELVEPYKLSVPLDEPVLRQDATSRITEGRLPPYNAYSADGDVTGELVYVNYGVPKDYEELERRGISVEGKIVIARYGGSWRGIKPKVAAEHGAIGCILYSDPRDDGFWQGDVYPAGAWRMEQGAQRGSVADMPTYPGDPLTPFVGAKANAERMPREESPTIMKIPVLPISYAAAQPLLEAITGPVAPESWRGALPITYHIGPGPATVRLHLKFSWDLQPAYDVIARLEGSTYPDEWIMRGNHHDAWVFGAADPISGLVALLGEARSVGRLAATGWKPKRTIVYAAWDAEEPGLLGSTEWAEHHAKELNAKLAVYINTDGNSRGFLSAGGSHSLERFVNQVARDVIDPQTNVSVAERLRARRAVHHHEVSADDDLSISPLGSGSDYTPFLQHLGIASLNVSFGGEGDGGSYHSVFDSFDHYSKFRDPGFAYGVTLAKTAGRMTLRLANADVLPFRFTNLAAHIARYLDEVTTLVDEMRKDTERHNAMVRDRSFALAADPKEPFVEPKAKDPVPHLNFAPVRNALSELERSVRRYDDALSERMAAGGVAAERAQQLGQILIQSERVLTNESGLPRRPWFRHTIYAPGYYTGYGVKTLPGIREAIEQGHWEEYYDQMQKLTAALSRLTGTLDRATAALGNGG